MPRTIFGKMVSIFISILIFSFSVAGVMLYFFLTDFVTSEKVDALNLSGASVDAFLSENKDYLSNSAVVLVFKFFLRSQSQNTGSIIWIVDNEGYIIFSEPELSTIPQIARKLKNESGKYRLPVEQQYKKVMLGQEDPVKEVGEFYGLFKDTGVSWLNIQKPIISKDGSGKDTVIGAVMLSTRVPEVYQARSSVFKFFLTSVLVAVLLSTVLIYVFSLRISRPLKEIKNAARVIAGGEFQKRLTIKSKDEIGDLASSFNHMATALEKLEEMRRSFIANVSHELRTPMTSIRGFIEGILDGTIPQERQKDYLVIVRDETNRLNRLVNDLLDLAKMEAGEIELTMREFDINELVRRSIIKLESLIVDKNLQVEANFEEEEVRVIADSDAIERVIINLVHNAVKFTPEKGRITLSTSTVKGKVHVSVQDTGIGISQDEINMIWERFYKSDKSRSKDKTGTGLGLAIVKNIINEHKEQIWVESTQGQGTKFTFTLEKVCENDI